MEGESLHCHPAEEWFQTQVQLLAARKPTLNRDRHWWERKDGFIHLFRKPATWEDGRPASQRPFFFFFFESRWSRRHLKGKTWELVKGQHAGKAGAQQLIICLARLPDFSALPSNQDSQGTLIEDTRVRGGCF